MVEAEASGPSRFLFISNGHGEDAIAAAIVARMPRSVSVEAYPMIGAGNAYTGVCPIVGPRAALASEGWRNVKGSLRRDIATGGLGTVPPAINFRIISHIERRDRGSSPVVGSSRKITGGVAIKLTAKSSRRRIPPE